MAHSKFSLLLFVAVAYLARCVAQQCGADCDFRALECGCTMVTDGYLDQPYCVVSTPASKGGNDSSWVCVVTRNSEPEGHLGEHLSVLLTYDAGRTWIDGPRVDTGNLTTAYSAPVLTDWGGIYVLYNRNSDNITKLPDGTPIGRDDELGHLCASVSVDGGWSWTHAHELPIRSTAIDRNNSWDGAVKIFWNVDQIKTRPGDASVYFAYTKIGAYPQNPPEELWLFTSPNLLTETNSSLVTWTMLPDGDAGVQPISDMSVAEEAHVIPLTDTDGFFLVFRTSLGVLGCSNTANATGASGWTTSRAAVFWNAVPAAAGRALKNPRGPITLKRFGNGRYLLLWYFNGNNAFLSRDPYWLSSGWEESGEVRFSQPEVILYDYANTDDRPGYPDFVGLANGSVTITETNKTVARAHVIDHSFLALLFAQDSVNATVTDSVGACFTSGSQGKSFPTPPVPSFQSWSNMSGTTLTLWISNHSAASAGEVLLSTQANASAPGMTLSVLSSMAVQLTLRDAAGKNATLALDDVCTALLQGVSAATPHMLAVTIDAGAHILSMSVDGALCDGGSVSPYGWAWIPADFGNMVGTASFTLAPTYRGSILAGKWYSRMLYNTEVIGIMRANSRTC